MTPPKNLPPKARWELEKASEQLVNTRRYLMLAFSHRNQREDQLEFIAKALDSTYQALRTLEMVGVPPALITNREE